jgi:hypothetical protein
VVWYNPYDGTGEGSFTEPEAAVSAELSSSPVHRLWRCPGLGVLANLFSAWTGSLIPEAPTSAHPVDILTIHSLSWIPLCANLVTQPTPGGFCRTVPDTPSSGVLRPAQPLSFTGMMPCAPSPFCHRICRIGRHYNLPISPSSLRRLSPILNPSWDRLLSEVIALTLTESEHGACEPVQETGPAR